MKYDLWMLPASVYRRFSDRVLVMTDGLRIGPEGLWL